MSAPRLNRRQFDRFTLPPMYSYVEVQRIESHRFSQLQGHVYDISEGGLRIELEERLDVGEYVNLSFTPPGLPVDDPSSVIRAAGRIVWITDEEDDPILPRMAVRIEKFLGEDSRGKLHRFLGSGTMTRAA